MIYKLCPVCGRPINGSAHGNLSALMSVCACKPPYIPAMDRGYPDAAQYQRMLEMVESQEMDINALELSRSRLVLQLAATDMIVARMQAEIADLKRAAQEHALQALSDMAQADDALLAKDVEIDRLLSQLESMQALLEIAVRANETSNAFKLIWERRLPAPLVDGVLSKEPK